MLRLVGRFRDSSGLLAPECVTAAYAFTVQKDTSSSVGAQSCEPAANGSNVTSFPRRVSDSLRGSRILLTNKDRRPHLKSRMLLHHRVAPSRNGRRRDTRLRIAGRHGTRGAGSA